MNDVNLCERTFLPDKLADLRSRLQELERATNDRISEIERVFGVEVDLVLSRTRWRLANGTGGSATQVTAKAEVRPAA